MDHVAELQRVSLMGLPSEIRQRIIHYAIGGLVVPYGIHHDRITWADTRELIDVKERALAAGTNLYELQAANRMALNLQLVCRALRSDTYVVLGVGCTWVFPGVNSLKIFLTDPHYASIWKKTMLHICIWISTNENDLLWAYGDSRCTDDDYSAAVETLSLPARKALNATELHSCELIIHCASFEDMKRTNIWCPGRGGCSIDGYWRGAMLDYEIIGKAVSEAVILPFRFAKGQANEIQISIPAILSSYGNGRALCDTMLGPELERQPRHCLGKQYSRVTVAQRGSMSDASSLGDWVAKQPDISLGQWATLARRADEAVERKKELDDILGDEWFDICWDECLCCLPAASDDEQEDDLYWYDWNEY